MRQFISYFIKYPVTANLLMVLIALFGGFGAYNLKTTFFPESPSYRIQINVTYPGASPREVEEGVVLKIEDNIEGISGVDRVTSISRENSATVTVEVERGHNTDLILQDVKNAVDRISSFPAGMEPLEVFKQENLDFAISFALSGKINRKALKESAKDIEDDLMTVDGISKVDVSGYPEEEIEISVREEALQAYNLTFQQVASAVSNANLDITGGRIEGKEQEMLIRARSKRYYAGRFRNIVVKSRPEGELVRLEDVADVQGQWSDTNPDRAFFNGKRAAIIRVQSTIDEDILFITEHIKNYIKDYNKSHDNLTLEIIRNQSKMLNGRINLLLKNGVIGFALVMVLLSLFLHLRLAFWVAIAIPLSFLGMFIVANMYGLTINQISLFGMILVIGILVDDGIIIGENIYQHYEDGKKPLKAALDGTLEVLPPVIAAVLTTATAFSAFFFVDAQIGDFMSAMAFVVIFTLMFSLVEGALILPSHIGHSKALKPGGTKNRVNQQTEKAMYWMKTRLYAPLLRGSLKWTQAVLAIAITLFITAAGLVAGGFVKTTFFPNVERNNIRVSLEMPSGTTEPITMKKLDKIENAAISVNKALSAQRTDNRKVIQSVQKKLGPSSNKGDVTLILLKSELRNKSSKAITSRLRKEVGFIAGAEKLTYGAVSPFGKPISVSLRSKNLENLRKAKNEFKRDLKQLETTADVVDNDQAGLREVHLSLKKKAKMLGLDLQTVMAQVRNGFFGNEIQRLQRGLDEVKVWVRYGKENRRSLSNLENMKIRTADGGEYFLKEIADFEVKRGIISINHLNGQREFTVEADLAKRNASATDILTNVENEILPPILEKYPSVNYTLEGQARESRKTGSAFKIVMPVILILMIGLVVFTFRSALQTAIIFLLLPFGFIGVVLGHWVHGIPISMLSAFGIIGLIGIMVNDSLVLTTGLNNLLKTGRSFASALYDAALSRFRPILLTSLTTIAGLAPLILENSFQAQFLIPMAVSVAYGMIAATFVTLVLLPVLLLIINKLRKGWKWLLTGKWPSSEEVEPSVREELSENI